MLHEIVHMYTVIDVITAPEKLIPLLSGASFRTQKIAFSPAGAYILQLV